ncbi:MAG: 30S ribosome-binding factor RbfA [Pseudomonadota bacterium]
MSKPRNRGGARAPSQRQLRAGELLRHALVDILRRDELRDPALAGVSITVSEVRASPDLRNATVYCTPLGVSEPGAKQTKIDALNRCARYLRGQLGREIELRFTPMLDFRLDESFEEARNIDDLLRRDDVKRDL